MDGILAHVQAQHRFGGRRIRLGDGSGGGRRVAGAENLQFLQPNILNLDQTLLKIGEEINPIGLRFHEILDRSHFLFGRLDLVEVFGIRGFELPERDHPARRVIEAHKLRQHKRVQKLCEEAGFQDPALAANLFYLLLEGATSCVQCKGLKRIGEDLVELVDRMIANSRNQQQRRL